MNHGRTVLIGLLALAAIGVVRATVLFESGSPSGIDGGNWLAFGSFPRPGIVYPPVVPTVFAAAVNAVGPVVATALAGSIAATLPGLAVLGLLAWARHPVIGLLAGIAVAASGCIGEIAAWGGYPQPAALAAMVVALVAAPAWVAGGRPRSLAVFEAAFALAVATSHLIALPGLVAVATTAVIVALRSRGGVLRAATLVGAAILPFLALLPVYGPLLATIGQPTAAAGDDVVRVLGWTWPLTFVLVLAPGVLAVVDARRRTGGFPAGSRHEALLIGVAGGGATWLAAFLATHEARLLYDVYVLSILAAASVVIALDGFGPAISARRAGTAVLFAGVAAAAGTGLAQFPGQVDFYRVLAADRYSAVEWLAAHRPAGAGEIVVADASGVPVGWWVEGIVGREVMYASDLRWLRFPSERQRAAAANAFLYRSGFPDRASAAAALGDGIALVLLPSSGAFGINPASPPVGWTVAYAVGDVAVLAPTAGAADSRS